MIYETPSCVSRFRERLVIRTGVWRQAPSRRARPRAAHIYIYIHHIYMHICIRICISLSIYIYIHISLYLSIYLSDISIYLSIYLSLSIYIYIPLSLYIYIYICIPPRYDYDGAIAPHDGSRRGPKRRSLIDILSTKKPKGFLKLPFVSL